MSRGLDIAQQLERMETILRSGQASLEHLQSEMGCSERTVRRYLTWLEERGVPLTTEVVGGKKHWSILGARRSHDFKLSDLLVLVIAKQLMSSYQSSGLASYMQEVVSDLRARMRSESRVQMDGLEEKVVFHDFAPLLPLEAAEDFNAMISSLIFQRPVQMRHPRIGRGRVSFGFEPYRLVVYKEGLYFVGRSLYHNSVRTFLVDDCREVELARGQRFEVPPIELSLERQFGLFGGPRTGVRLWFSRQVARYVKRRRWHASQEIVELADGVELRMTVDGTTELVSWILGFGGEVEVLEPATLRAEVAREQRRGFERNAPSSAFS